MQFVHAGAILYAPLLITPSDLGQEQHGARAIAAGLLTASF